MGSFGTFEIARTGLNVSERGLYVTGHNISNVNTKGYVRQQMVSTTKEYQNLPDIGQVGTGADVEKIRQVKNAFIDNLYRSELENLGYYEAKDKTFNDIQSILDEPMGDGLQSVLNEFWNSWQELSKEPDSLTARALVRQRGESLTKQINHLGNRLDKLQDDLNTEIKIRVEEINKITEQIADLNLRILKAEVAEDNANDLNDQRNLLLDEISKYVNVGIDKTSDGQVNISIGGYMVVYKGEYKRLKTETGPNSGLFYEVKLEENNAVLDINGGELKGLLESRGLVMGAVGSESNGTPNNKVDINIAVDTSNGSAAHIAKIKGSIDIYISELKNCGLDFNLRLMDMSDTTNVCDTIWTSDNIETIGASFSEAVDNLFEGAVETNNFSSLINAMDGISYRNAATKYAVLFTDETIGGDEVPELTDGQIEAFVDTLNDNKIKMSIVSSISNYEGGSQLGETSGWKTITQGTGGNYYDIDSTDYDELVKMINKDINDNKNEVISEFPETTNVITDLKKRLNAMVNIIAREINYLHRNGYTLDEQRGENFFVPIDDDLPLEMGNFQINSVFSDLDKIVASEQPKDGDNGVAVKIGNLRDKRLLFSVTGSLSPDNFYNEIISMVGTEAAETARIKENQQKLVSSSEDFRQAVEGVSMDEEMANMMKYKYAYSAASKIINVVNTMLDTVIERIGAG